MYLCMLLMIRRTAACIAAGAERYRRRRRNRRNSISEHEGARRAAGLRLTHCTFTANRASCLADINGVDRI